MGGPELDNHGMIEVLQLTVANIRAFVALHEASELQVHASSENRLPQLVELQSLVARVEAVLSHYELELPKRTRA